MAPALSKYSYIESYSTAEKALGNRRSRVIGNNTELIRKGDDIAVELHGNEIIRFFSNGNVRLSSRGYETSTTKDRLNRYTPRGVSVRQRDYKWYLTRRGKEIPFEDGMTLRF